MSQYTYLFADLMTNAVLAELPCFSTNFDLGVSKVGNGTFNLHLDMEGISNDLVIASTTPGRTALYVDRDGVIVWGGIIWTRTYSAQSKSLEYTAQTFESYASRRACRLAKTFTSVDSRNILLALYRGLMTDEAYSNIGITVPANFTSNAAYAASLTAHTYDFVSYQDLIDRNSNGSNGPEYYIHCAYDTNNVIQRNLVVGSLNVGKNAQQSDLIFEYPGSVGNYFFPENVSKAANRFWALGSGDGSLMKIGAANDSVSLLAGYPLLDDVQSFKDVTIQTTLNAHAAQMKMTDAIPVSSVTLTVKTQEQPEFGSYDLGDYFRFDVHDPRFPNGVNLPSQRIIGWTLNPSSSETVEVVTLVIQGAASA